MSTHDQKHPVDFSKQILQEANRCVACGLCLPHCPTYRKTQSEADSPRGRIALMKGVLENKIPLNPSFVQHIDSCLTCRACESACPSSVEYGRIVDGVRPLIEQQRQQAGWKKALSAMVFRKVLGSPVRLRLMGRALRFYQQSGLQTLLRRSSALKLLNLSEMEAELPEVPPVQNWRETYPAIGTERGKVGLFLGCVARLTETETLNAAIFVLNHIGYTVHVPDQQGCCGALPQHSGHLQEAAQLALNNRQAFSGLELDAIISTASGCGALLGEYHTLLDYPEPVLSAPVMDIGEFLARASGWDAVQLQPLAAKVVVQEPCTLRNVQHAAQFPYEVLSRIPQATVEPLAGNDQCCGAAGMYHVQQPEMAGMLRNDKIVALQQSGADYLATSNVGCAMWLAQGMREQGMKIEVIHPVTLVARQMGFTGKC